jgi:hypothetical protein
MMFKDESIVVAKKAEKKYDELAKRKVPASTTKELRTPSSEGSGSFTFSEDWSFAECSSGQLAPWTRYPTPESMTLGIMPSVEEQAQCFFIANYVAQSDIIPRGELEWVTELLGQSHLDEAFRASVNATSLAGFANATKSPAIMRRAQVAYTSALRMTNSALSVKETAVKDSTLVSVIMLGMYGT